MAAITEVAADLTARAARYGGDLQDMLDLTPVSLWDSPSELAAFWEDRDLSHIFPQSTHPELANDWGNIIAEDSGINRARGAEVMTEQEINAAEIDNQLGAETFEDLFDDDSAEVLETLLELVA